MQAINLVVPTFLSRESLSFDLEESVFLVVVETPSF